MSLMVIFPVGKEASADAYLAWCNTNNPDVGYDWYDVRVDAHGQRVVGYLGPGGLTWNSAPFPEPEGGPEARADGVLQEGYDPPVIEDD